MPIFQCAHLGLFAAASAQKEVEKAKKKKNKSIAPKVSNERVSLRVCVWELEDSKETSFALENGIANRKRKRLARNFFFLARLHC